MRRPNTNRRPKSTPHDRTHAASAASHDARTIRREGGWSLLEALVAMTILVIALVSLAQLFAVSTQANARARATTYAAILAAQKMEQLRALTYEIDAAGLPITDTTSDVTTGPAAPAGGRGLSPSPPTSLDANTDGYCDFVDANGRVLGGGAEPPPAAMYVRRWAIAPLAADPANTIVLQVIVTGVRDRVADDARIMSVKTRKAA